jgi:hypothetical protein
LHRTTAGMRICCSLIELMLDKCSSTRDLALHTLRNTNTSTDTVFFENATVRDPLVDTSLLESLLRDVDTGRTSRLLQHTKVILAKVGKIVDEELSLASERRTTFGVEYLHVIGGVVKYQTEVVPYSRGERRLPKSLLWTCRAGS